MAVLNGCGKSPPRDLIPGPFSKNQVAVLTTFSQLTTWCVLCLHWPLFYPVAFTQQIKLVVGCVWWRGILLLQ